MKTLKDALGTIKANSSGLETQLKFWYVYQISIPLSRDNEGINRLKQKTYFRDNSHINTLLIKMFT